jgi:D-methionine transport system ATP-binding protein
MPEPKLVSPSSAPIIRVRGLTVTYPGEDGPLSALDDVNFELAARQRLGIVGESGAGKSTLLRCLNLLVRPARGSVEVDGRLLTSQAEAELPAARRQIGMIFQHFALLHRRTVADNVALPLALAGVPRFDARARVEALLAQVRLSDKANAYPAQLSGGQRQRAGLARALAMRPRVLLCDEPTSALDPETARHVAALLGDLATEHGLTVVFVTHQLGLVRALADVVAVLDRGKVAEFTPATAFFAGPRSAAGCRLLESERGNPGRTDG